MNALETEDKQIKHFARSAFCQHNLKRLANVNSFPTVSKEVHKKNTVINNPQMSFKSTIML